jgi:hypothetical protein
LGDDLSGDSQPDTLRPLIFVMYWSVRRHASRSTMLPNICSIKAWRSLKYPSLEVREHRYRSLRDDHREGCLTIVTMITTITISSSTQCNQPLATNGVLTKVTLLPRRSGKFIWRLRSRTLYLVDRVIGRGPPRELLTLEVNDDEPEGQILWTGALAFSQLEVPWRPPARIELEVEVAD